MKFYATRSLSAALLGLVLMTASCKKETDITPDGEQPGGDKTPAFVGKNLRLDSFIMEPAVDFDGDGKVDPDLTAFMRPCDLDNTVRFEKTGKLSGSNGAQKCDDDTDPNANPGSWSYNESTKILTIKDGEDPTDISEWKVVEATSKGLKAEVEVSEDGTSFKAVMSWKAI
ncbi:hypothetical protein [Tellurirhabdus rosea]|uniref:hypothetical protein n=1 Tax=Tellurirhabdus rosea TaxID=2674997 RepID=UPI0022595D6D|nr:hypothetical protein [Tellurirhabdus rosea]